jgi:hypothetical protein
MTTCHVVVLPLSPVEEKRICGGKVKRKTEGEADWWVDGASKEGWTCGSEWEQKAGRRDWKAKERCGRKKSSSDEECPYTLAGPLAEREQTWYVRAFRAGDHRLVTSHD